MPMIGAQLLEFFVDFALQSRTLVVDCSQVHCFVVSLFFGLFELRSCFASLCLDLGEELQERLGVFLEHGCRTVETKVAHFVEVRQPFNLLVFLFKQHLNQEHLSLLLDQVPAVLSVFGSLNWHVETCSLCNVDLVRDVRVNC